jgi:hypothetical protein
MKIKIEMPFEAYLAIQKNKAMAESAKIISENLPKEYEEVISKLSDMYTDLVGAIELCVVKEE